MKFLPPVALLASLLVANASQAQETATPPSTSSSEPSAAVPKQKPYFVPAENMLMRCKVPAFLKCVKWKEPECVATITKAVAEGNAEVEAEAASKPEAETNSAFFKGYAMGIVLGQLSTASKGRLLGCLQKN